MDSSQERISTVDLIPFAERYGLKIQTIINRIRKECIPGIVVLNKKYTIMSGTRYPYDKRKIKKTYDTGRKRLELLRAIKDDRYIDESILKVDKLDFDAFIKDYLRVGFIEERQCENHFGANNYRTTIEGNTVFEREKKQQWRQYMEAAGIFMGEVISRTTSN